MQVDALNMLPAHIAEKSISTREVVLPEPEARVAINVFESNGVLILGWEGWVKAVDGQVGHGSAPQGTGSIEGLSVHEAAQLCRETIPSEAAKWQLENPSTTDIVHFCITVRI